MDPVAPADPVNPAERTRWLHRRSEHGYTTDPHHALPREPPAPSENDYQLLADAAERRQRERAQTAHQDRRLLSIDQRLTLARAQARARHIDVSSELRWMRLAFEQQRNPATLARRLETLEARVAPPGMA